MCDTQSTRCLIAHAEWVQNTMLELSSVTLASSVEFLAHLVGRFRRDVTDERERRVTIGSKSVASKELVFCSARC